MREIALFIAAKCSPWVLLKWGIGRAGNERGERENKKWEQNRELEMNC